MGAILYRISKRHQLWLITICGIILGVSGLVTGKIIGNFPQDNYLFYPVSAYSMGILVIPFPAFVIYKFLFPLIASMGVGDLVAEDLNSGYIKSFIPRSNFKKYLSQNMLLSFFIGGIISIVPAVVNFISLFFFIPHTALNPYYSMFLVDSQEFIPQLYYGNPLIYFIIRIVFIFIFGGALSVFATSISFLMRNRYLSLAIPMFLVLFIDMIIQFFVPDRFTITSQFIGTQNIQVSGIIFITLVFIFSIVTLFVGVKKHEI
ncbi:hypothetical protein D7I46_08475 [Lactococcus allomyrinae]|uniref:ABC transporter permease n=2 Tax=Lactococcus allomyrinae TaxID=2419773 RepID=A0A387BFS9_9LACT|nr:hypothetical protein D7I46_08475 [Lactococcus allomyrinae]